ncbi:hypothetical protein Pelo_5442 [Pelomyxa schiedti]|nr:hypothetical protein Pelo_5442 [Pelomyxa schiedti]
MTLAEALFPLVPRACSAATASLPCCLDAPISAKRSSYFALKCAAAAGGASGERGRCASWILSHKTSRNNRKECAWVLWGFCAGGHALAAVHLAGVSPQIPSGPNRGELSWIHRAGLHWPPGAGADDEAEVRKLWDDKGTALCDACREGHLDVAKWLVARFGERDWKLFRPFLAALRGGHVDVAEWIASRADVRRLFRRVNRWSLPAAFAARGGNLKVIKWCFGMFPESIIDYVILDFLRSENNTADELVEGCKWLVTKNCSDSLLWERYDIREGKVVRWLVESVCDVRLVEWLMENYSVQPVYTPIVFQNEKDSVPFTKFMLQTMKEIPSSDIQNSIHFALLAENLAIADFLDETFHVEANKGPKRLLNCVEANYSCEALNWFLQHVPTESVEEEDVMQAIELAIKEGRWENRDALLLLKKFHISHHKRMRKPALTVVVTADISTAKQFASEWGFSQSEVAEVLASEECKLSSSKVVRWLIGHYGLSAHQVKANNNTLLHKLIKGNKVSCAEWLIRTFDITLHEFSAWMMLLRCFPEITPDIVRESFSRAVIVSPWHIEHALHTFGFTVAEISEHCRLVDIMNNYTDSDWPCGDALLWARLHNKGC